MNYLTWDSTVKVNQGYYCFHTITEFRGVDWKQIEENVLTGTYSLDTNLLVETSNGLVDLTSVEYLGIHNLVKLVLESKLEDKIVYLQKKQKVCREHEELGEDPIWLDVKELKLGDKLITNDSTQSTLRIKEIVENDKKDHLWSINIEEDTIFYIQYDILVKA